MKFEDYLKEAKNKPIKLGTIWTARAKIFDEKKNLIGTCMDTPNAIAKCFMEQKNAVFVIE